jgi:DNA processing protein
VPKREQSSLFTPAPLPTAALDEPQRLACLRLIRSDNVGPVTFRELINHFGGAAEALAALPELSRRAGHGRPMRICPAPEAEAELEAARRAGASPVFTIEPGYPRALAAIETPPPMLYVKGDRELLGRPALAIVGSRQASAAALKLARLFAGELGRAGLAIVSGLARGVDAAVHQASLATGTIAVLAGGIDVVYPPENAGLQAALGERGCLLSERPPGFAPRGKDFPRRNRLISGVALGVLVIEAARKSGTLVTARFAAEQGREVFAVPGHPLDPRAEGTNQLLRNGATLAAEPADVLAALRPIARLDSQLFREPSPEDDTVSDADPVPPDPIAAVTARDRDRVLAALGPHPVDIDELARAAGIGVREARIVLLELDLAGCIERHGANLVSRLADDPSDQSDLC